MTPERWDRIQKVFQTALERAADEREVFVDEACGSDADLRREVMRLLHEHRETITNNVPRDLGGQAISHYKVIEKLGEGGMGVVYKARDTKLNRYLAIKVLPADKVADVERKRRFIREAQAASALNHPNIVTIYEIAEEDGTDFIAMEYFEGKTLDELIPRNGMRLREALQVAVQVADALAAVHDVGIIHRDIKPGNIMVDDDGRVRVLDFGLAKLTEVVSKSDESQSVVAGEALRTDEGTILGTASYMSPEQAEGKKLDARSDIFSFGSVLYEMLTGRRPFVGDSIMLTLAAIINTEPEPLPEEVPYELKRLVERCLRKSLRRRHQHIDDVRVALEDLKDESDSGSMIQTMAPAPKKNISWKWVVAATLAVVLCGAGLYWRAWSEDDTALAELVTPLTSYPGTEGFPSFSPDGRQVAFCWNGPEQDNTDIYVRLVGAGEPLRLTTSPEVDIGPAWSPDGQHIAFMRFAGDGMMELYLVPSIGGRERRLGGRRYGGTAAGASGMALLMPGPWVRWSPDGEWLALPGISLTSVKTGESKQITKPEAFRDYAPAFSPDGRHLAFVRARSSGTDLMRIPLADDYSPAGEPQSVVAARGWIGGPVWTNRGDEILFSDRNRLWRINSMDREPARVVAGFGENGRNADVARGMDRLVYERQSVNRNIWSVDLTKSRQPHGEPTPVAASTASDAHPEFAPDGKQFVFISERSGATEIWVCDADGTNALQLTAFGGSTGSPQWSPDGRRVLFDANTGDRYQIFVVSSEGGVARKLTEGPSANARPYASADGEWIYFQSDRSGSLEIWKMPSEGGDPERLTQQGGTTPRESPDGRHIYYTKGLSGSMSLWRVSVDGGDETEVLADRLSHWRAVPVGRRVFFAGLRKEGRIPVEALDVESGEIETVTTIPEIALSSHLSISSDEEVLLYEQVDERSADLMLVENFR